MHQALDVTTGALFELDADTDYEVNVYDADNARTAAVCIFEVALQRDTTNGYIVNGVVAGQDIDDAQILAQNLLEGSNSFPLLAVPFFILAGTLMSTGAAAYIVS